jgi:hypothetical protein
MIYDLRPDRPGCPSSELPKRDSLVRRRGLSNHSVFCAGIPKSWSPNPGPSRSVGRPNRRRMGRLRKNAEPGPTPDVRTSVWSDPRRRSDPGRPGRAREGLQSGSPRGRADRVGPERLVAARSGPRRGEAGPRPGRTGRPPPSGGTAPGGTGKTSCIPVVRRERRCFPVGASPTRPTQSLRPEAIGAAAEVTKPSEPSRQMRRSAVQRVGRP